MRLTRSKALPVKKDKKVITRNTICSQIFNQDELKYCCSNCESNADVLSIKKSRKEPKSNKNKHIAKQCQKPWYPEFATTNSRTLFHLEVCAYL